jgi:hypothetical protein
MATLTNSEFFVHEVLDCCKQFEFTHNKVNHDLLPHWTLALARVIVSRENNLYDTLFKTINHHRWHLYSHHWYMAWHIFCYSWRSWQWSYVISCSWQWSYVISCLTELWRWLLSARLYGLTHLLLFSWSPDSDLLLCLALLTVVVAAHSHNQSNFFCIHILIT